MTRRPSQKVFTEDGREHWIAAPETDDNGPTMQGTLFDVNDRGLEMDWRGASWGNTTVEDYDEAMKPPGALL